MIILAAGYTPVALLAIGARTVFFGAAIFVAHAAVVPSVYVAIVVACIPIVAECGPKREVH